MLRATPDVLRVLRQRYEETDQLLTSIASEFGICVRTLGRMRQVEGWHKRSDRLKELPKAVQLLEEAQALAKTSAHSRASGNPDQQQPQLQEELGPRFRGGERGESALGAPGQQETPSPALPLSEGGSAQAPDAIDRLEALVLKEIAVAETARERVTDKRQLDKVSDNSARTLATLTQTLRTLRQMRTGKTIEPETATDDPDMPEDMPRDLDEFRHALARRIEALFANEIDAARSGGNSGRADANAAQ